MFRFWTLATALCSLLSAASQKNRVELSGIIRDAQSGEPIAGVTVMLTDFRMGTSTDSAGAYKFTNLANGHTLVEISHTGYKTVVDHLDLGGSTTHDFTLEPSFLRNEGVTITAVANATNIRNAPISISRVSRADLLAGTSTNIVDALSRQPGISQLATGPAISKPVIRGLGYNRLVVINDGTRQEGQQWGDEHGIEIDENSVSRVEIVKGPASLIYGSDAIAGVINIITTQPVPVNTIRGSVFSGYQTNNRQRSLFANFGGNKQGFNWNAWGDYKAAADYRNKYDGPVYNSKFNEGNYGGYAGLNGAWGYTHLIFSSFNQELGLIEGERDATGKFIKPVAGGNYETVTGDDFNGTTPGIPYQKIGHLKFVLDNSFTLKKGRISLNTGWQRNARKEFGDADAPEEAELYFDLRTFTYNAAYHLNHSGGWSTSIGIGGMAQENNNRAEEVLIPEYRLFDMGAFLYSSRTVGKTTLSGGVRYDRRSVNADADTRDGDLKFVAFKKSFANISASAGISYAHSNSSVWKFNLARGFRAPSLPELSSNGAHEGTNRYEYGDLDLKSERSLQADAGWEGSSAHLSASANIFYNYISDFIFYSRLRGVDGSDSLVDVDGEPTPAFQFGQRNAFLYGGEASIDLHPHPFDWLHWQNTFSYVRGQFSSAIEGVNDLPLIPAPRWTSELRAALLPQGKRFKDLTLHFDAERYFKQAKAFTAFGTETPTPAYTLLNAGVSTIIVSRGKTLCQVYINALNLGDVAYQSHLSRLKYTAQNEVTGRVGVFNTGRNFSFKLLVPFSF